MNILQKNFDSADFFFMRKKHHLRPYKVSRKTILLGGEENYPSFLKRGTMSKNASFVIAQIPTLPF